MKPYKQRTYFIQPHQKKILEDIKSLPSKGLYYLTIQQSNKHPNLTLSELKNLIRKGIRQYIQQTNLHYHRGLENELVKFYGVFETTKDFFHSQHQNNIIDPEVEMGIHCHLFISSIQPKRISDFVCLHSLIFIIYLSLTSIKHKRLCVSKFDYKKIDDLDENFVLYHTKQFMFRPSNEMIMKNI